MWSSNERIKLSTDTLHAFNSVQREYGFVFLQLVNAAYVPLTRNWICSAPRTVLPKCIFLATDKFAEEQLRKEQVNVFYEGLETEELQYGTRKYYLYMLRRTEIVEELLLRGVNVWVIESDAMWFEDPTSYLQKYSGYDVIAGHDDKPDAPKPSPQGGFIYLNATQRTLRLWQSIRKRQIIELSMFQYFGSEAKMGNEMLILRKRLNYGVRWTIFDPHRFVSGLWYRESTIRAMSRPVIIQNNWIKGNGAKIQRAKEWGHWFLRTDMSCKNDHNTQNIVELSFKYNLKGMPVERGAPAQAEHVRHGKPN